EEEDAEKALAADEEAEAATASAAGVVDATLEDLRAELAIVDEMRALAEGHAARPDARVKWLVEWIRKSMLDGRQWNRRRLIIFTEWEDTRRWLERRLREALADTDGIDDRIGVFSGATGSDRREQI